MSLPELKVKEADVMSKEVLPKFPVDSKVKFAMSLQMGYCSGFVSFGCGLILKLVHDGLREAPVGVHWEAHRGEFICACLEWGKIFLQLSPELWEKGIWGRENGASQSTWERKYRVHPRKTQSQR